MTHDARPNPESLLAHGPRLRALARQLVRDEHRAADLVQDTWVKALERRPGGRAPLERWLASVLRHLAFQGHRLEARRAERERAVARGEASAAPEERFAAHKELVAAIDQLAEPVRETILLRYFEDLPPRKIAARFGVPVKTVKARLGRGLALLRAELERRHGGRQQWLAALLPLLKPESARPFPPPTLAHVLLMKTTLVIGSSVVVLVALVYLMLPAERGETAARPSAPVVAADAPHGEAELRSQEDQALEKRASLPATSTAGRGSEPAIHPGMRGGRVLDPEGNGLAGVIVGFEERDPQPVVSGPGGAFEIADSEHTVVSLDERFATVLASRLDPRRTLPEDRHVVVVAPAVTLGGVVLDERRVPVVRAFVQLEFPLSFRGRFHEVLDNSREQQWLTETDDKGGFLLAGAPGLACAKLVARPGSQATRSGDNRSARVRAPDHDELGIELVLTAPSVPEPVPDQDALHLAGEVRHIDGRPAPGALVSLDGACARADEQGLFELSVPRASARSSDAAAARPRQLVAVAPGEQAAFFVPERDARSAEQWPAFVTLRLGAAPKSIAGLVRGTDGQPRADARVWIEDVTFLGETRGRFLTLENQMASTEGQGDDHPRWSSVRTDSGGRFELGGLGDRGYTIAAMDPATLQVVRVGPVAAGSRDVELLLRVDGLWERIAGRVVDTHGQPLAGLHLEPKRVTNDLRSPTGSIWRESSTSSPGVLTDEAGRFELEGVPRSGVLLRITGSRFATMELALDTIADPLDVRVEVPWLAHLQIELAGTGPAKGSIELLGPDERPVQFCIFGGDYVWTRERIVLGMEDEFADGRTPVLSVPETARAAVLRDAQQNEIRRVPLVLGESLTTVRL